MDWSEKKTSYNETKRERNVPNVTVIPNAECGKANSAISGINKTVE
jgi:hypothetical protein